MRRIEIEIGCAGPVVLTPEVGPVLRYGFIRKVYRLRQVHQLYEAARLAGIDADRNQRNIVVKHFKHMRLAASAYSLNGDLARIVEVNWIINMVSIERPMAVFGVGNQASLSPVTVYALSPSGANVIFRPRTAQRWVFVISKSNLYFAFAPPGAFVAFVGNNSQVTAKKAPAACNARQNNKLFSPAGLAILRRQHVWKYKVSGV